MTIAYVCINDFYIVNGGWSSWAYGSCSSRCGRGKQTLTRRCSNPKPSCGGNDCPGLSVRQNTCYGYYCYSSRSCSGKIIT